MLGTLNALGLVKKMGKMFSPIYIYDFAYRRLNSAQEIQKFMFSKILILSYFLFGFIFKYQLWNGAHVIETWVQIVFSHSYH